MIKKEDLLRLNPPDEPGVYIMSDAGGKIIYVGKAGSLRKRLLSYFRLLERLDPKTQVLRQRLQDIEFVVTGTEIQALILEYNLIKKHRPRYNILMRDDKSYPYLKLTMNEPFPRLLQTRKPFTDDARYFGPFTQGSVTDLARVLSQHFGLRLCKYDFRAGGAASRACLYAQMAQCDAVCTGEKGPEAYAERVRALLAFLEGGEDSVSPAVEQRMSAAAAAQQFEIAASLRNQLNLIRELRQKPLLSSTGREDRDVFGLARLGTAATVEIFTVRTGNAEGRRHFFIQNVGTDSSEDLLSQTLTQYYSQAVPVPPEILVPQAPSEQELILAWLRSRRGGRVRLRIPRRGAGQRLVKLAETNAWLFLKHSASTAPHDLSDEDRATLADLGERLGLTGPPLRVEGYDISNISGTDAVGSRVVFMNGQPDKSEYRRYQIRSIQGPNDVAMLQEVLYRRFKRLKEEDGPAPDLVVVDGGAGQLSAALAVLKDLELAHLPVVGLAKAFEEIYIPGQSTPVRLPLNSRALQWMTRLRDEAHRFAITYHRAVRGRRMRISQLDKVDGLGAAKRQILLRTFGSVEALLQVDEKEIASVPGIGPVLAKRIRTVLGGSAKT